MVPEIYMEKREWLLDFINATRAKSKDFASGSIITALTDVEEKLKRNSFEIVLAGGFSGGKSTTFNAICDCRKISPMGQGIKTSATKISAMSIPENEEEYVEITWKNEQELLLTVMEIIGDYLDDPDEAKLFYKNPETRTLKKSLTLQDPEILKIAKASIDFEWEIYQSDPAEYDPDGEGRLDLLQISTLILNHCQNPELAEWRNRKRIPVGELQSMVVFPGDWAIRWNAAGKNTEFQLSEVLFVFLGYACYYIHSRNLERLGCIITDCPGLFAGQWDTAVARRTMMEADAIVYLIDGNHALTNYDLKTLKEIILSKQQHKLFFAINAKRSKDEIAARGGLRETDCALLRDLGLELDPEDIGIFHARLAFNALYPTLKDLNDDEKNVLQGVISADLSIFLGLSLFDKDHQNRLNAIMNDQEEMAKESGFYYLLIRILHSIVSKKAESILVKAGSERILHILKKWKMDQNAAIDYVEKTREEINQDITTARESLANFHKTVCDLMERRFSTSESADLLADDFVEEVFVKNSAEIAACITDNIKEKLSRSSTFFTLFIDCIRQNENGKLKTAISDSLDEAYSAVILPAAEAWFYNIFQKNNRVFNETYGRDLTELKQSVRDEWKRYENIHLLDCLSLEDDWLSSAFMPGEYQIPLDGGGMIYNDNSPYSQMLQMMEQNIKFHMVVTDAIIGVLSIFPFLVNLIFTDPFPVSPRQLLSESVRTRMCNRLQGDLRECFNTEEMKDSLKEILKQNVIARIVESLKHQIQASLEQQKQTLEESSFLSFEAVQNSQLQNAAEDCKKVRDKIIDPSINEISAFHDELVACFQQENISENV